jgi:hypothetical protein
VREACVGSLSGMVMKMKNKAHKSWWPAVERYLIAAKKPVSVHQIISEATTSATIQDAKMSNTQPINANLKGQPQRSKNRGRHVGVEA